MTRALCSSRKAPFLAYFVFFFPSDQLVSVDKGGAVMAQREARTPRSVLVLRGTLFDTDGLRGQTGQRDESGKAASNGKICLQSVNLVAKQNRCFGVEAHEETLKMMSDVTVEQQHSDRRRIYQPTCPCC